MPATTVIPESTGERVVVTFVWSTRHGWCADCLCPAAFEEIDAYGNDLHKPVCAVCAANTAAEGNAIRRIEPVN